MNKTINPIDFIEIDTYKPWLSGTTPRGYWENDHHRLMAIKWLFEERLKWNDEQIKKQFEFKHIRENQLSGLYAFYRKQEASFSAYAFVDFYTNGRIRPWELKNTPRGFFDDPANQVAAVKWLIEDKLKWERQDIINHFNADTFKEHGLHSLYKIIPSYYDLLNTAYPDEFHPWEVMDNIHTGYWDEREHCIKAIKWLLEQKNKTLDDFLLSVTNHLFLHENGFHSIYQKYKNMNKLKEDLFPEEMKKLRHQSM